MNNNIHYHPETKSLFVLDSCEWCRGAVRLPDTGERLHKKDSRAWGEPKLPPEISHSEEHGCTVCARCEGRFFYIEQIKSEYAIIKRPHGEYVDGRKSLKAATALCNSLNDSLNGTEPPDVEVDLTTETDSAKLDCDTVVIRLAGPVGEYFKRGDHVELPINELLNLINTTGVKPMAKPKERKTAKDLIRALITSKKNDEQILTAVAKDFPDSNADKKHCTKYRRELFIEGAVAADLAAVGSREHQEWAKANMAAAKRGPHKVYWQEQDAKLKERAAAEKKAAKEKADRIKAKAASVKKASAKKPTPKKPTAKKAPAKFSAPADPLA